MSLRQYQKKREFKKTPEPSVRVGSRRKSKNKKSERGREKKGKVKKSSGKKFLRFPSEAIKEIAPQYQKGKSKKTARLFLFVVHEHHASHLHWDLRLEMNGVLKSWAVPKQPPRSKGTKRLAIQVEDHPLQYITFHGIIPEGNYGAGKVIIWDKGKYNLIEKNSKKIIFELHGKKLKGKYALVKTNYGGKKNGWLFFKI